MASSRFTHRTPTFTFSDDLDDYPENWLEQPNSSGTTRLKPHYRAARALPFNVSPSGVPGIRPESLVPPRKVPLLPSLPRHARRMLARDRNRLASLSGEGRSSATTILVGSVLRWMHGGNAGLDQYTRKLLGFTDNRQDAALQAGHFNDFLFVESHRFVRASSLPSMLLARAASVAMSSASRSKRRWGSIARARSSEPSGC